MLTKLLSSVAIAAMLAACNPSTDPVLKLAASDLQTATAVANSPNVPATAAAPNAVDPQGYACWGSLTPAVAALQSGTQVGLATMVEVARVAIIQVRSKGSCAGLAAPLLSQLALIPGAGNAIAMAAASVQ
jgi:hypothetical protein